MVAEGLESAEKKPTSVQIAISKSIKEFAPRCDDLTARGPRPASSKSVEPSKYVAELVGVVEDAPKASDETLNLYSALLTIDPQSRQKMGLVTKITHVAITEPPGKLEYKDIDVAITIENPQQFRQMEIKVTEQSIKNLWRLQTRNAAVEDQNLHEVREPSYSTMIEADPIPLALSTEAKKTIFIHGLTLKTRRSVPAWFDFTKGEVEIVFVVRDSEVEVFCYPLEAYSALVKCIVDKALGTVRVVNGDLNGDGYTIDHTIAFYLAHFNFEKPRPPSGLSAKEKIILPWSGTTSRTTDDISVRGKIDLTKFFKEEGKASYGDGLELSQRRRQIIKKR
jgi:hypothetical protein